MNSRNLEYLRPLNYKRYVRLADEKLRTKQALIDAEIPTPKLYGIVRNEQELAHFDWEHLPQSFVLKPNQGLGGGGIIVIFRRKENGMWVAGGGYELSFFDLLTHIFNVFDGQFSLANTPDTAFFEERIKISVTLKPYAYQGIPDIRVIVFNRVPVMAMLRLPTQRSQGKANLTLGGVGVGIDIATGVTTHAMVKSGISDAIVERHPDNHLRLSGIRIPYWNDILEIAVRCQDISKLGLLGVDIAIDKEQGPMVLEINARPGLSIQTANLASLGERLRRVRGLNVTSVKKGVRLAKDLFGGEIEEEVQTITGRQVIGIFEDIVIEAKEKRLDHIEAKIDTGAFSTSMDREIAGGLGFSDLLTWFDAQEISIGDLIKEDDETIEEFLTKKYKGAHPDLEGVAFVRSSHGFSFRPKVVAQLTIDGRPIMVKANIVDRSGLRYRVIVGRRDLKSFLVDARKV